MTQKQRAARNRMRYEARLRAEGKTVGEDMADLQDRIRAGLLRSEGITADRFVTLVRRIRDEGRFSAILNLVGAKYGAGVSPSRALGNLVRAVRPPEQVGPFIAAFYDEKPL